MSEQSFIRAGIMGAAGYTGGELIRLLLRHPYATVAFAHSDSNATKLVSHVHHDLEGETDLCFSDAWHTDIDVLFFCSGHGAARDFLGAHALPSALKVIDLSNDFRLQASAHLDERQFVYGLPELDRESIINANSIANPGCFATAIQLALLPLAKAGLLTEIYTTGITGSTGAGQSPSPTSHFSWRADNIQAYKTLEHQHIAEIEQSLNQLQPDQHAALHFVPWRGDFTRGIFTSSVLPCDRSYEEIFELYEAYYADAPFTYVSRTSIDLKRIVNTNKCLICLEKSGNKLAVHSAIDNLLKGASGQAVQNMNLLFGLPEQTGLQLKASAF